MNGHVQDNGSKCANISFDILCQAQHILTYPLWLRWSWRLIGCRCTSVRRQPNALVWQTVRRVVHLLWRCSWWGTVAIISWQLRWLSMSNMLWLSAVRYISRRIISWLASDTWWWWRWWWWWWQWWHCVTGCCAVCTECTQTHQCCRLLWPFLRLLPATDAFGR